MTLKEKEKKLHHTYEAFMEIMTNERPWDDLDTFISKNFMGYGTAKDEKFSDFRGVAKMLQLQEQQGKDHNIKFNGKPVYREFKPHNDFALFVDEYVVSMDLPEGKHEIPLRLSCLLVLEGSQWKIKHFHGSTAVETEEDTWHLEEWKQKMAELQGLVDEKTADLIEKNKDLEIEAALERVRSRTMAMHKTSELQEVINTVYQQLIGLNLALTGGVFIAINEEIKNEICCWGSGGTTNYVDLVKIPYMDLPIYTGLLEGIKKGAGFFTEKFTEKEKHQFFEHLFKNPPYLDTPLEQKVEVMSREGGYTRSCAVSKHTSIFIINHHGRPFTEEENLVLKRFGNVFEQSYTRFLDLKKAEEQAREAQIEAALERVRSSSLAMHNSAELGGVITVIVEKLKDLGFYVDDGVALVTFTPGTKDLTEWMTNPGFSAATNFLLPHFDHPVLDNFWTAKEKGEEFVFKRFDPEESRTFHEHIFEHSDFKHIEEDIKTYCLAATNYATSTAIQKNTAIFINDYSGKNLTADEIDILKRFAKVFEQTYTRFLDLQKAEEQALESQIETALERVRSRTMGMQKSEELSEVAKVLFDQFKLLGKTPNRMGIGIIDGNTSSIKWWVTDQSGSLLKDSYTTYASENKSIDSFYSAWENGKESIKIELKGKELIEWLEYIKNKVNMPIDQSQITGRRIHQVASFSKGLLLISSHEPIAIETCQILERFAKVFNQTYTRFLDLQKAEIQAREAQIEAALERIRSRSMAMHKTDELSEVILVVFKQLELLNIIIDTCYIDIFDNKNKGFNIWIGAGTAIYPEQVQLPYFNHPIHQKNKKARQNNLEFFSFNEDEKSKNKYFDHFYANAKGIDVPENRREYIAKSLGITGSAAMGEFSGITMFNYQKITYSEEENKILTRVNKVFQQTYIRFLDLQKAESQAREAEIEAALERVRSKAMAMRTSEDISEATSVLFQEVENLNIETIRCGIVIIYENKVMDAWSTSVNIDEKKIKVAGQIDMTIHPLLLQGFEAWENQSPQGEYKLEGKDGMAYYEALNREMDYSLPDSQIIKYTHYCTWFHFKQGGFFTFTKNPLPEIARIIFERFAKVFELTYQRYRELIESEKRAKEAKKQASLDRVRGEIASMRSTQDLERITPIIWDELTNLGVPFLRCGVFIIDDMDNNVQLHLSDPKGNSLGLLTLDFTTNSLTNSAVESWRSGQVYKEYWTKQDFIDWMKDLQGSGKIDTTTKYQGGETAPESLHLHFVPFSQGMLYVGNLKPLSDDHIGMVKNLAESFSVAYARYEDFNLLEKAKENIEKTLKDLKATQKQLVQSEKMASLGELTAGIAHEIQNPLNFVNNFSEVSTELLEEMREEIKNGDLEEVKAIMNDVLLNLEKINHHGKRADSIVKGMLQHSRKSDGSKELTDINALTDEYLRLAYHGLRAKNKSFNAELITEYENDLDKISVIPQDLGRVLLNLFTNAFYAVDEKKKNSTEVFKPKVFIKTKKEKNGIVISVKDNGEGIPNHVIEKIFQPFFTTKPTGQGTGLGLSMSYDIIKAHGGEISVDSNLGNGTEFTIILPKLMFTN